MKIFGKWESKDVKIKDPSIRKHISLVPSLHTGGRHSKLQSKAEVSIVERLTNKMMRKGRATGKKHLAYNITKIAFEIIHEKTKKNPLQVLVNAIENAGPREETVRLKYGGIAVPKAVDTSPQRRVDQALMFIAQGAQKAAFKTKRPIEECLASEIISASKYDVKAFSISKKEEKERIAKAAR
jgi:small subunit ribosomal protein S7